MERDGGAGPRLLPPDRPRLGSGAHAGPQRPRPSLAEAGRGVGGARPVAQAARLLLQLSRVFFAAAERGGAAAAGVDLENRTREVVVEDAQRGFGARGVDEGRVS